MSSKSNLHPALLSRCTGSLLGALIGDCHGSPFEFAGRPHPKRVLDHLLQYHGEKPGSDWPDASPLPFSDDTAMTRSVAASLVTRGGYDALDMAKRFGSEYEREPDRGYGFNVTTVFDAFNSGQFEQDIYGPAAAQFGGSGSYGNGGAMRIAPVALFQYVKASSDLASRQPSMDGCPSLQSLLSVPSDDICVNSTRLTHSNSFGIHGALLQCFAVKLALRAGLLKEGNKLDVDAYVSSLIEAMREVEGKEDDEQKSKKARVDEENRSVVTKEDEVEEDEEDDDEGYNFYSGDNPSNLPYAYVEKLEEVKQFLKDHEASLRAEKPSPTRNNASDPLMLKRVTTRLGNSVAALGSVPVAIYCFLRSVIEESQKEEQLMINKLTTLGELHNQAANHFSLVMRFI